MNNEKMLELISNNNFKELYSDITDANWWRDKQLLNNKEREKYLYERFVDLYDLIIKNYGATIESFELINICKNELDRVFSNILLRL